MALHFPVYEAMRSAAELCLPSVRPTRKADHSTAMLRSAWLGQSGKANPEEACLPLPGFD